MNANRPKPWAPALVALAFPQPQNEATLSPESQSAANTVRNYRARNQSLVSRHIMDHLKELKKIAHNAARHYGVDPEDVLQTAIVNMLNYGGWFDASRGFVSWASPCIYHAAREEKEKSKRSLTTAPAESLENASDNAHGSTHFVDMRDLLNHVIAYAAYYLDTKLQLSLMLWSDGWSQHDAAAMLGIPRSTHSIRLLRAREKIIKQFGHLIDFGTKKYRGGPPSAA